MKIKHLIGIMNKKYNSYLTFFFFFIYKYPLMTILIKRFNTHKFDIFRKGALFINFCDNSSSD